MKATQIATAVANGAKPADVAAQYGIPVARVKALCGKPVKAKPTAVPSAKPATSAKDDFEE